MKEKRVYLTIALFIFFLGIFMIINSFISLTGAVVGLKEHFYNTTFILGISLIVIGIFIFEFAKDDRLEDVTESEADRLGLPEESGMTKKQREYVEKYTPNHLKNYSPTLLYRMMKFLGKAGLKRVSGKEKLPKGPKLFIANHRNPGRETAYLMSSLDSPVYITSGEKMNFGIPGLRYVMKKLGMIPLRETLSHYETLSDEEKNKLVRRAPPTQWKTHRQILEEGSKNSMGNIKYIRNAASILMQGKDVGVYAEGPLSRLKDDSRRAYAGYALIAREYQRQTGKKLPIVPVGINKGSVAFGDAYYVDEKARQTKEELEDIATDRIHKLYDFAGSQS